MFGVLLLRGPATRQVYSSCTGSETSLVHARCAERLIAFLDAGADEERRKRTVARQRRTRVGHHVPRRGRCHEGVHHATPRRSGSSSSGIANKSPRIVVAALRSREGRLFRGAAHR